VATRSLSIGDIRSITPNGMRSGTAERDQNGIRTGTIGHLEAQRTGTWIWNEDGDFKKLLRRPRSFHGPFQFVDKLTPGQPPQSFSHPIFWPNRVHSDQVVLATGQFVYASSPANQIEYQRTVGIFPKGWGHESIDIRDHHAEDDEEGPEPSESEHAAPSTTSAQPRTIARRISTRGRI